MVSAFRKRALREACIKSPSLRSFFGDPAKSLLKGYRGSFRVASMRCADSLPWHGKDNLYLPLMDVTDFSPISAILLDKKMPRLLNNPPANLPDSLAQRRLSWRETQTSSPERGEMH